jgi:hypothetical protein
VLRELELDDAEQGLQAMADAAFRCVMKRPAVCAQSCTPHTLCLVKQMPTLLPAQVHEHSKYLPDMHVCRTDCLSRLCVLLACCSEADAQGRGIVNFGQVVVWYSVYMLGSSRERHSAQHQQQ